MSQDTHIDTPEELAVAAALQHADAVFAQQRLGVAEGEAAAAQVVARLIELKAKLEQEKAALERDNEELRRYLLTAQKGSNL